MRKVRVITTGKEEGYLQDAESGNKIRCHRQEDMHATRGCHHDCAAYSEETWEDDEDDSEEMTVACCWEQAIGALVE